MVLKWHFDLHSLKKMEKVATLKIQIISIKIQDFWFLLNNQKCDCSGLTFPV